MFELIILVFHSVPYCSYLYSVIVAVYVRHRERERQENIGIYIEKPI